MSDPKQTESPSEEVPLEEDDSPLDDDTPSTKEAAPQTALVPQDPLQRYLAEIRRHPLLSVEEEHELAVRYHEEGDVDAAYRLVTANLRLVVMIARRYQRAVHNLLDLIQEGNVGLMEAVKKFDPYREVRFPSYAVWWIRAYIIRYIMNNFRLVKMGTTQAQRKLFFNLQKEKRRLEAEGFEITPKLIAQRLDVKPEEVEEMDQRMSARDLSVDAPIGDGEDSSMLDVLSGVGDDAEESVSAADYARTVRRHMDDFRETLAGKDRIIFDERLRAEDPKTLQELGDEFGVSRERVRQIEERVKKRLRTWLEERMEDLREVEILPRE